MTIEDANEFIDDFLDILSQSSVEIPRLNREDPGDMWLALALVLRGSGERRYISIVDGLHALMEKSDDPAERRQFHDLAGGVMNQGGRVMGIEWD